MAIYSECAAATFYSVSCLYLGYLCCVSIILRCPVSLFYFCRQQLVILLTRLLSGAINVFFFYMRKHSHLLILVHVLYMRMHVHVHPCACTKHYKLYMYAYFVWRHNLSFNCVCRSACCRMSRKLWWRRRRYLALYVTMLMKNVLALTIRIMFRKFDIDFSSIERRVLFIDVYAYHCFPLHVAIYEYHKNTQTSFSWVKKK